MKPEPKQNVGLKLDLQDITNLKAEARRKRTTLSGLIRTLIFKEDDKKEPQSN